ncbi:hypothetical protein ECA4447 [Pectobacterium atrosepticum SCRI1043]|uniref:DUF6933 domain-containing protein n=1 Tax=Pectobacterium atrosepticum (strain SCRI 1043 / ATCC BAA-672) TaxID=218491 RepID=Q6CYQ8_PECAS|nr:hypothetical protein [Pectobacterium atrosepticum]GKV87888.1 hypothetical protein PEC301296_41990 [Pectobacterium carotovorum subsp. carotovorum]AIA73204.1 hypothetical protein EV46_22155 [Pectobacterium atrosepticum]AIK16231.1 hypothetical protein GZ59_45460 [Pectobacterium atrosepticum]ATY92866.1 hypothetical protein CVS35_22210 [Pectobacterium atrosepticum]KFX17517.1 hypothetical protein JV34_00430 [Pectobacterium atrosepticum]
MIQLHATHKLFKKLPLNDSGQLDATPRSQWLFMRPTIDINPLSNWHGNLITLQRRNCVLLVHDATRFPLVLPALIKKNFAELNNHFVDAFINTLLKCGADEMQLNVAQNYLRPLQVDTQCSRSVQGTLNQMKGDIEHIVRFDNLNISELTGYSLGQQLADRPCSVKNRGYLWPQKEMLALLSQLAGHL